MTSTVRQLAAILSLASVVCAGSSALAYKLQVGWGTSRVDFFVNPKNADGLSATAVVAALQTGANAWATQSNAAFQFQYAGAVSDTTNANDGRNVVLFRNATNGSAIASTYSWSSGGKLLDTDVIFWDGGFKLFAGTSGCVGPNAVYIEDIAAHEFGHALGLGHSTVAGATMTPGYSTCSQTQRTLAADDIAGVEALYPPQLKVNTPPTLAIYSPTQGISVETTSSITFSGSSSDPEDGDLTSGIEWRSNISGLLGRGGSLTKTLPAGLHTITALAADSAGLRTSSSRTITVVAPTSTPSATLTARGYYLLGVQKADLSWTGITSYAVDIYRNGARILTVINKGIRTDAINKTGPGTYTYKVCESGTTRCTPQATVTF